MEEYCFDEIIDRKKTNSKKWTNWSSCGFEKLEEDVLPFWIADTDFRCCKEILEGLKKPLESGVLGYDAPNEEFFKALINWTAKRIGWDIKKEWIIPIPGVVPGITNSIVSLTSSNAKVLIQEPVYPPFFDSVTLNGRKLVQSTLIESKDKYLMDFEDFDAKLKDGVELSILCNPHNPVGRVWTKEELEKYAEICIENNSIIVSDEIHSDLILKNNKHIPIASISEKIRERTITLMAPSKTFNVAGLSQAVAIIPNEELREKFVSGLKAFGIMHTQTFGIEGFTAAYTYGENWLNQCLEYIENNIDFTIDYIRKNIPQIKVKRPDATFLLWLDMRDICDDTEEFNLELVKEGKLLLGKGTCYGESGNGFFRFNVGCPRALVEEGLKRLEKFVANKTK